MIYDTLNQADYLCFAGSCVDVWWLNHHSLKRLVFEAQEELSASTCCQNPHLCFCLCLKDVDFELVQRTYALCLLMKLYIGLKVAMH